MAAQGKARPIGGGRQLMDILYLLIPLSVVLVFLILGGLWWAIERGQFEDIEGEGERILEPERSSPVSSSGRMTAEKKHAPP